MIGLIWNIRGMGQDGKIQCVCDVIARTNPDFIGFEETKKETISEGFLKALDRAEDFMWHLLPADNIAGGILLGLKRDLFKVIGFINTRFSVKATVKNKNDGFLWHFVVVYGSAYPVFKMDFISELQDTLCSATYPVFICGDFNLVSGDEDKSSGLVNQQITFLFNDWVNRWALLEIPIANRKYT